MQNQAKVADNAILQRYSDTIDDLRFNFEKSITALDLDPVDYDALHLAAGIIAELKTTAKNEEFPAAFELTSKMEEVLVCLVNGQFVFIHLLSDVLLISYDHLFDLVNNQVQPSENFDESQSERIVSALAEITTSDSAQIYSYAEAALQILTSQFLVMENTENVSFLVAENQPVSEANKPTQKSVDYTLKMQQDLMFFKNLMEESSFRFPNIKSRCERVLPIALEMNHLRDNRVDPFQLEAAIYLHDVGMSFISDEVLTKTENYTESDRELLKRHPLMLSEMLRRMESWNEAADMVLQHHERIDGSGYPGRLKGNDISDGAKVIAILDAFDAMTHIRSDRDFKKTILRAVREIVLNNNQFDAEWADVFVSVIKTQYSK